jgi:regulator of replication initiation timing
MISRWRITVQGLSGAAVFLLTENMFYISECIPSCEKNHYLRFIVRRAELCFEIGIGTYASVILSGPKVGKAGGCRFQIQNTISCIETNWKRAMPKLLKIRFHMTVIAACASVTMVGDILAQSLKSTVQAESRINVDSARSQTRVTDIARQTQDLLAEYRSVVRETDSLRIYNDNLQRVVTDQRNEVQSINRQLSGLEETNRGVVPLMLEMIDALDRIVEADIPFRIEERRMRVQRLRDMMDQAEVTASEKYRRVMEAYQSELEFGRTTEAYSDTLPTTGQTVDFLRVGRTLLVYQTSDNSETGWFNPSPQSRQFEQLPDRYRLEVKEGLAIAKNEKAPNLVILPVPLPEVAQ